MRHWTFGGGAEPLRQAGVASWRAPALEITWTPPDAATYQNLPNLTTPNPPDQIGNSPNPTASSRTPPDAAQELSEMPAASAGMTGDGSVNSP